MGDGGNETSMRRVVRNELYAWAFRGFLGLASVGGGFLGSIILNYVRQISSDMRSASTKIEGLTATVKGIDDRVKDDRDLARRELDDHEGRIRRIEEAVALPPAAASYTRRGSVRQ